MVTGLILAILLSSEGNSSVQRLIFEKNKGQAPADVHYLTHTEMYDLNLNRGALVFHFGDKVLRVRFDGELNKLVPQGQTRLDGLIRYVNSPDTPDAKVPKFASVRYESLYNGIDFMCYGRSSQLECDFVILPTGNPRQIRATIEGSDRIELDQAGNLLIHIGSEVIRIRKPTAYQLTRGERRPIDVQYRIQGGDEISFVIDEYNRSLPLVIDPR